MDMWLWWSRRGSLVRESFAERRALQDLAGEEI